MVDLSSPEKVEEWLAEDHWMTVHSIDFGAVDVTLHCGGLTELCRAWTVCEEIIDSEYCCYGDFDGPDTEAGRNVVRHGVKHLWDGGRWTIPTDKCVVALPIYRDLVDRILTRGLVVGNYPVRVDWVEEHGADYATADWDDEW